MAFDVGTAVGYLDLDTSGFTKGFARARADMRTFSDENATFNDKLAATGSIMKNVGSTMTTWVTLPLVGIGTAAMKIGNEFESQMSRVQAISGATGEQLQTLTDQAMDLGASTSFSASSAALGMEQLASAGFTVEEIYEAMPGLLDLAASSGADLATASEIAASAVRGFGLEAADTGYVADLFAEAAARTNAQVEDMGEAMKYIAPVAHAMGLEIDETAAAVGILSDAGIKGSQAGTTLRGALTRLTKPTKNATEVMKLYGMSFYDANGSMLSMEGIIGQLEQGLSGLTQKQRNQALTTLFGQEALSGMLVLLEAGPEKLAELSEGLDGAEGAAQEMAEVMLDNTAGALEEFGGAIETAAINIQQILAPVVTNVVQWLTDLVNAFNNLDKGTQSTIVAFLGIAAAVGPVLLVLGKLVGSFLSVKKYFSGLTTAFSAGKGIIAALGGSFGPILLVIGAVAAAILALKLAWETNFGEIQEKTVEMRDSLQAMFTNMTSMLQSWGTFFLGLWESDWMGIQTAFTTVWDTIESVFSIGLDTLNEIFKLFAAVFEGDWSAAWESIKTIFNNVVEAIKTLLEGGLNALVTLLTNIAVSLYEAAYAAFEEIKSAFSTKWGEITAWFEAAKQDPVTAILGIATALYEAGSSIMNSLLNGMKAAWETVSAWAIGVVDWLKNLLNIDIDVDANVGTGDDGHFASGLDYVPRDMVVKVHEGESIRTKQQTREDYSRSSGGDTFNFYSPTPIDEMEAAKQMKRAKRDLAEGF